jgi:hypothetical protein
MRRNFLKKFEPIHKRSTNLLGQSILVLQAMMLGRTMERQRAAEIEAMIQPCPEAGNGRGRRQNSGGPYRAKQSRRAYRNLKRIRKLNGSAY